MKKYLVIMFLIFSSVFMAPVFANTATINIDGTDVITIKSELGAFSSVDRAGFINKKIKKIAKDYNYSAEKTDIVEDEGSFLIKNNDVVIMTITPKDALAENTTQAKLAKLNLDKINNSIKEYRKKHKLKNILLGFLYSILITTLLMLSFKLLNFVHKKIISKIEEAKKNNNDIYIQRLKIVSVREVSFWIKSVLNTSKLFANFLLLYFYFTIVLGMFPWTAGISNGLKKATSLLLLTILNGFIGYLPKLLVIVGVIVTTYYLFKTVDFIFAAIKNKSLTFEWFYEEWIYTTKVLVKILLVAISVIIIYPLLPGAGSDIFKSFSIFAGILISIGSTRFVSNMLSGVILTYTRSFKEGERVKIVESYGDVVSRDLLVTRIKTLKNEIISIPNSKVLDSEIINYSRIAEEEGLIVHTAITIGYDTSREIVESLLIQAAKITENIVTDKEPFVLKKDLNDYHITYEINAYTYSPKLLSRTQSELNKNILDVFSAANVEIMSPNYIALRQGDKITIPNLKV